MARTAFAPMVWLALAALAVVLSLPPDARAGDDGRAAIRIEQAWARASIGTMRPAAAYVTVVNDGGSPVTLTGVASPVAGRAEVHKTVRDGGTMAMMPAGRIVIEPGQRVAMQPGGFHIMLMDLNRAIRKGETIDLTLSFADGTALTATAGVLGPGAKGPDQ